MAGKTSFRLHLCTMIFTLIMFLAAWGPTTARSGEPAGPGGLESGKSAPPASVLASPMRKGPYLIYNGRNTTMTVLWQTYKTPVAATIEWGTSTAYGHGPVKVKENSNLTNYHQFEYTISNLEPGAKCFYRVSIDGSEFAGSFTAAPNKTQDSVTFYGYGDSRPSGFSNPVDHDKVLKALLSDMSKSPDERQTLLVNMGDYVWNGLNEFLWDLQQFNPVAPYDNLPKTFENLTYMGVLGNHEGYEARTELETVMNHENIGELFKKYYPYKYPNKKRFYYSFDYGPVHFVILDTWSYEDSSEEHQAIDNVQMKWLKNDLKASKKQWKIAMLHTPIWGCAAGNKPLQDQLTPVLRDGGVHLVLQGHDHLYTHAETDGIYSGMTWLILGGGGAELEHPKACVDEEYKKSDPKAVYSFHFARFEVTANGIHVTVKDTDEVDIDSFDIPAN